MERTRLRQFITALLKSLQKSRNMAAIQPKELLSSHHTFYYHDLEIVTASSHQMQKKPVDLENLKFGHAYADHMIEVDYSDEVGWKKPLICPLKNFSLHPGCKALHYAIQLFEGMKAYRGVDNRIRLFRPEMNIARMKQTSVRSSLPDFDTDEMLKIIHNLIRIDKDWVPYSTTASLYIRPTIIGTDPTLGVAHSKEAKLFVLSGPIGAYYPTGFKPISLLADPNFVRAFPGGVGSYKMGCNYAPTILIGKHANAMGCQQVLWLYDHDEKLTEVGTMNIFVYWINKNGEKELLTPPLTDGLILPGVTRDSLLEIARKWNEFVVTERYPTMSEIKEALREKRMLQIFGSGTACVVSPVGKILHRIRNTDKYEELLIPTMESKSDVMQRLFKLLMDIQYGRTSMYDWAQIVE